MSAHHFNACIRSQPESSLVKDQSIMTPLPKDHCYYFVVSYLTSSLLEGFLIVLSKARCSPSLFLLSALFFYTPAKTFPTLTINNHPTRKRRIRCTHSVQNNLSTCSANWMHKNNLSGCFIAEKTWSNLFFFKHAVPFVCFRYSKSCFIHHFQINAKKAIASLLLSITTHEINTVQISFHCVFLKNNLKFNLAHCTCANSLCVWRMVVIFFRCFGKCKCRCSIMKLYKHTYTLLTLGLFPSWGFKLFSQCHQGKEWWQIMDVQKAEFV